MTAFLLSSLISLFMFMILGIATAKLIKLSIGFFERIWIGVVMVNVITTLLSFILPIDIYVLLGVLVCSIVLVIYVKDEVRTLVTIIKAKKNVLLISLPFILIALIVSLGPPLIYDAGLYHIPYIKWIEEYAVVPGLANLHGRFGFNPNIFTVFALTSLNDLFRQEIFSVNFTLLSILILYFINTFYWNFKEQCISNVFLFNLIVFVTILNLSINFSTPTPDFISIALPLFIFTIVVNRFNREANTGLENYAGILILCTYALTVKLATLPLMILLICVISKYRLEARKLLWMFPMICLIVFPWLARNVILTGWLVYPFPSLDLFNFDWKVPLSSIIAEKEAITGWARIPGDEYYREAAKMNFFRWFPTWWAWAQINEKILFACSLIFPVIAVAMQLIRKIKADLLTNAVVLASFVGVIFWLFMAPDFRFGKSFIVVASISPLLYFKFNRKAVGGKSLFALLMIVSAIYFIRENCTVIKQMAYETVSSNRIWIPHAIEKPENLRFKIYKLNGADIYVPESGDRCFDLSIPCAPDPGITLLLRGNTLQSGFKRSVK